MNERWKEFKTEVRIIKYLEESKVSFIELTIWFQKWAAYITKGGDRPPRPHG